MIVSALSAAYGTVATWRRRWYTRAERQHHLSQPVISIGNLRVGGSGKTPVVAHIATLLLAHGERPSILSRGYARREATSGVTVVSDLTTVRTDVAHAGDEPFLLAQMLPGVPVLVCPNRYEAGREAETRFGVTVHLLDDGFQHVKLARDIDLLLVDAGDLTDRVLPAGRLREPLANAASADALIGPPADRSAVAATADRFGISRTFTMTRALGTPTAVFGAALPVDAPVCAAAGIARPERFFDDLRAAGFHVAGTLTFPDHHAYTAADLHRIVRTAMAHGALGVVTTEKDAVKMTGLEKPALPFSAVPLTTQIEPVGEFAPWLLAQLARRRQERSDARP